MLLCMITQLISEYNGEDKFMTRIGVGGLINLDRIHQAELLLNDIRLFHQHAAAAAAATTSSSVDHRQTSNNSSADAHSQELTPENAVANEQLVEIVVSLFELFA